MTNRSLDSEIRKENFAGFVKQFNRYRDLKAKAMSEYYNYDIDDSSFDFEDYRVLENNYDEACRNFDSIARVLSGFVVDNFDFIKIN